MLKRSRKSSPTCMCVAYSFLFSFSVYQSSCHAI
uniref:Uncharacterized protein n=1 Tax=Utricularia reniformis TaxID=192314 RepID=A0A1Y0B3H2_9LAMI|nr:hypothetical protein AEK19_MT1777 [Utricularia reniformis]ART31950.1 hypothetical protein AEK19_MT1777 [Utricularia reniformis]